MNSISLPSIEKLNYFRQESDEDADKLVADLYLYNSPKEIGFIFKKFIDDLNDVDYSLMPPVLKKYFNEQQVFPKWINKSKIELAENLFLKVGPEYSSCLLFRALPIGYVSANTVKVLTSTGYLASDLKTGTAKRLLETTQFIFNVMGRGSLEKEGSGLKNILKVRFIHAMIRYHLQKHEWDSERYGIPINQEDMAGTILTFSIGAIEGLDLLNIRLNQEEKDAITHLWAVVGHFIGLNEELNFQDYREAKELYNKILEHQAKYSLDGVELTNSLVYFMKGFMPLNGASSIHEHLIRFLINNSKYSDMLNLAKPKTAIEKIRINTLIGFLRTLNNFKFNKFVDKIKNPANRFFAKSLISYFDTEFNLHLNIPEEIKSSWGLESIFVNGVKNEAS